MKKSYLLIAAAATIMASCSQNESLKNFVAEEEAPQVIGFNTISEKATRASIESLETYHNTFAVYATKKSNNDENAAPQVIFDGDDAEDIITYDANRMAPNNWTYSPYRYWDKQATYSFVAVAPNTQIVKYSNGANVANNEGTYVTVAPYTLVGQNLQTNAAPAESELKAGFTGGTGKDTDLMTATKFTRNGADKNVTDVSLEFKHILAKLNIAIAKDPTFDNVKVLIKNVKISGLDDTGIYNEATSNALSGWTASSTNADYALSWKNADGIELLKGTGEGAEYEPGKFLYFIESLIMPQEIGVNAEKLTIDYTIVTGTKAENYNYILYFNDGEAKVFQNFLERNNYTIFLTVRPNIITFDATTDAWVDKTASEVIVPVKND